MSGVTVLLGYTGAGAEIFLEDVEKNPERIKELHGVTVAGGAALLVLNACSPEFFNAGLPMKNPLAALAMREFKIFGGTLQ